MSVSFIFLLDDLLETPRSIMVKLLGRAKRLNEALKLAEDYRKVLEIFSGIFGGDLPR